MRWELYCRVVDNFGDIGFAWRLAADLASRGEAVRLVVDDASALAWLAPRGADGVVVETWPGPDDGWADVGVETFGCGAAPRSHPPAVSIDVEHLSAEGYVERSHGLPTPRTGAGGQRSAAWLYYPGFTDCTGGLLREPDISTRQDEDERAEPRRVVVFGYANAALDALFDALAATPTLVTICPGVLQADARSLVGPTLARGALRATLLPFVSQPEFDRLLRASSLNLVRGEDSLVRAAWAGEPFVWQLYPQADGAHVAKLEAFLDLFLHGADAALQGSVRSCFRRWNGLAAGPMVLPELGQWREHCRRWRRSLLRQNDLTTGLVAFAAARHREAGPER